jgi:3-oxoacyl-[acyl-carrier protein] reductase
VAEEAGSIDISFNLIAHGDVQGTPLAEMSVEDFTRPVVTAVSTTLLTARAAARHMIRQGSGVILAFGGSGDPMRGYEKMTMLGRAATLEDVGNVAAFVASDRARTMTAATVNISCGALID